MLNSTFYLQIHSDILGFSRLTGYGSSDHRSEETFEYLSVDETITMQKYSRDIKKAVLDNKHKLTTPATRGTFLQQADGLRKNFRFDDLFKDVSPENPFMSGMSLLEGQLSLL